MAYRKGFRRGSDRHAGTGGGWSPGVGSTTSTTTSSKSTPDTGTSHHGGGEWSGPTYSKPDTVTYQGPSRGEGIGSQTFNRNLRTIQKRYDYNRLANQRAHPFLSKLGGIGGLLKGIGKAGLSFFGGLPGKALSGIMTASDYAKRKGSGVLQGIGEFGEGIKEFGEHDNLMSYLNRNKIQPIESMPTNQEIIGQRVGEDQGYYGMGSQYDQTRMPVNITNNMGANNQFLEDGLYSTSGLGAAEGGRIIFVDGGIARLL